MEQRHDSDASRAMVPQLEARLAATEIEFEEVERSLAVVREKIEASINRLRKRPSINGGDVG